MINQLSELYTRISQQLPGASASVLDNEFRNAERIVCKEASVWSEDDTFTTVADTYDYTIILPSNTDLVYVKELQDVNENVADVTDYIVGFQGSTTGDGYVVTDLDGLAPDTLAGEYTDYGDTFNGKTVYSNSNDVYILYKAVLGGDEASSLYIITSVAEYLVHKASPTTFPVNYYTGEPPASAFTGLFEGQGTYLGTLRSEAFDTRAEVTFELNERLVDGGDLGAFTATLVLAPTMGFSSAPASVLTWNADVICKLALRELLAYPDRFPWSDPQRYLLAATEVRRMLSKAKQEPYRPLKRATLKIRPQSFI